jgi:hypothetical protein
MFRTTSSLPRVAAAITVATVIAACGSSSPSSSGASSASSSAGRTTQAQIQHTQEELVRFAACMRAHGVPNFPDPATDPVAFKQSFSQKSPAYETAGTDCQHLLPASRQQSQSAAQTHAQVVAGVAFARCIRSHGFPRFPDPSATGQLSHQMLATAGINIHEPAVVLAADACVGVTHGLITRSDVARFVAGQ